MMVTCASFGYSQWICVVISESFLSSLGSAPVLFFLSSVLSTLCWWWCFPVCSPQMKKVKRRLTVDPFDFELGLDCFMESRGRPLQVAAAERLSASPPALLSVSALACFCFSSLPNSFWQYYISAKPCHYSFSYLATIHSLCIHMCIRVFVHRH